MNRVTVNCCLSILLLMMSTDGLAIEDFALAKAQVNLEDIESIKRGAKFFAATCMSCHTVKYLHYDSLAKAAGVDYDKMPLTVKDWPYGVTPPDLSLEADIHGPDWIDTYLHSFYRDTTRPTGFNNLVLPNTAMPAILAPYQGEQQLITPQPDKALFHTFQWYDLLELTHAGSVSPEQFDGLVTDLVNFLVYAAAPYTIEQQHIGRWVLGVLVILLILAYLLKKEYWKEVKKYKDRQ